MDIATIIGLVGGTILVCLAIVTGGNVIIFVNIPGLLIVVGGTVATCFIKFSMSDVINSVRVAMKVFTVKIDPPDEIMEKMISIAKVAKERGLMALENEKPDDEFAAKAFQFLADGFDEEQIKELLLKDINLTIRRHSTGQKVFKGMGSSAPAFGMIGTLIGLVQMLSLSMAIYFKWTKWRYGRQHIEPMKIVHLHQSPEKQKLLSAMGYLHSH